VRREREDCCDDVVLNRRNDWDSYARTLLTIVQGELLAEGTRLPLAPEPGGPLSAAAHGCVGSRIRRILRQKEETMRRLVAVTSAALLGALVLIGCFELSDESAESTQPSGDDSVKRANEDRAEQISSDAASRPAAEKIQLQHVFRDGQVFRGSIRRERLMGPSRRSSSETSQVTTTTELSVAVKDGPNPEARTVLARWGSIHVLSEVGGEVSEFRAGEREDSTSRYDHLVGREFVFLIGPKNETTLLSGLDEFLASLEGRFAVIDKEEEWKMVLEQFVREPNAYLPSRPVAVGDRWTIRRPIKIVPIGYYGYSLMYSGSTEDTSAHFVGIDETEEGRVARVDLSGRVGHETCKTFELKGTLRINVDRQNLERQHVVLTDPKTKKAHLDNTWKFVVDVEIGTR